MSTQEVCEYLNINYNHLHQLQYRKKIVWVERKGRNVYYDRKAIEAFGAIRNK
jgi:hypothetical protein